MPRQARTKAIYTRVTEDEHATITTRAGAARLTVSEYLRRRALEDDELAELKARVKKLEETAKHDDMADVAALQAAALGSLGWLTTFIGHTDANGHAEITLDLAGLRESAKWLNDAIVRFRE